MLQLEFEYFTTYDAGKPGIDLDVSIQLTGRKVISPPNSTPAQAAAFLNAHSAKTSAWMSKAECRSDSARRPMLFSPTVTN